MRRNSSETLSLVAATLTILTMAVACADNTAGESIGSPSLKMGMDAYIGASNMPGKRCFSDGMWAGSDASYPSVIYLRWSSGPDLAKVSFGTGQMYTSSSGSAEQPVEAWLQMPVGGASVTIGKYWVPFAQQEWLYETKPGVMAQWEGERTSLTVSANRNLDLGTANGYLRGACQLGNDAEIGLSVGGGQGFCAGSVHDRGVALDTTVGFAGLRFYGECNLYAARSAGNAFRYFSGKLYYEKLGAWKPFVAGYWWTDQSQEFGDFRSTVCGFDYQMSPSLGVQAATSSTSDGAVSWLQLHWTWERDYGY